MIVQQVQIKRSGRPGQTINMATGLLNIVSVQKAGDQRGEALALLLGAPRPSEPFCVLSAGLTYIF